MRAFLALLAAALPAAHAFLAPANGMIGLALRHAAPAVRNAALPDGRSPRSGGQSGLAGRTRAPVRVHRRAGAQGKYAQALRN
jgi:hypothetical protein